MSRSHLLRFQCAAIYFVVFKNPAGVAPGRTVCSTEWLHSLQKRGSHDDRVGRQTAQPSTKGPRHDGTSVRISSEPLTGSISLSELPLCSLRPSPSPLPSP